MNPRRFLREWAQLEGEEEARRVADLRKGYRSLYAVLGRLTEANHFYYDFSNEDPLVPIMIGARSLGMDQMAVKMMAMSYWASEHDGEDPKGLLLELPDIMERVDHLITEEL